MRSPSLFYLQNRILCSPSDVLFTLLIFILSKNLNATAFQLTLMACLKPITSLFSFYISTIIHGRPHLIRSYLLFNTVVGILPCFFYPFVDNVWFYIASYALYMTTKRAQEPAWSEFLKGHLNLSKMPATISRGSSITYFMSMCLPPILSIWLDGDMWKILFVLFAILQLINLSFILFLRPGPASQGQPQRPTAQWFIDPLKKGWHILRSDRAFSHYLILFFLGGAGIIAIQPILPKYFDSQLGLSYTELTLAFSFCKGISFLISSPIWAKYTTRISLYRVNAIMNAFTCLFIVGLLSASFKVELLYAAYLCYGAMQGGSELTWNLSGPIFSKRGDSTPYSSLNMILVGIRGCICPFTGYLLFTYGGVVSVFAAAFSICFIGLIYGLWLDTKFSVSSSHEPQVHRELSSPSTAQQF